LTAGSYKLTHLTYKLLTHYLGKCKVIFQQHLTVISTTANM